MVASSHITSKAVKDRPSEIQGRSLVAVAPIGKDEIVAIKGGHIVDTGTPVREQGKCAITAVGLCMRAAGGDPEAYGGEGGARGRRGGGGGSRRKALADRVPGG